MKLNETPDERMNRVMNPLVVQIKAAHIEHDKATTDPEDHMRDRESTVAMIAYELGLDVVNLFNVTNAVIAFKARNHR